MGRLSQIRCRLCSNPRTDKVWKIVLRVVLLIPRKLDLSSRDSGYYQSLPGPLELLRKRHTRGKSQIHCLEG
jgi:hypothetical protein